MDLNLGYLTKPATLLIEKISNCIGILYEPTNIKKIARAKAEASKIEALSKIEISAIEKRALISMLNEETKKQENTEKIIKSACESLNENSDPSTMDEDWISHFFEKCKIVSNVQMQSIWGKLLATEANNPGRISKKTIELVATLDKNDAQLFTNFCSFIASDSAGQPIPLILNINNSLYTSMGINFESLTHLEYLGLISFNKLSGFCYNLPGREFVMLYHGTLLKFIFPNLNAQLQIGSALLTKAGKELAPISGSKTDEAFLKYLIEEFEKQNIKVELLILNKR